MKLSLHSLAANVVVTTALLLVLAACGGGDKKQTKSNDQNNTPVAQFSASPNPAIVGESVSFNSSASSDADNDSLSYRWQFGDGVSSEDANPTHVYSSANTFTVSLTVTDSNGASSAPFTAQLVVNAQAGNQAPTARLTATPNPVTQGVAVNFDGSGSSDPDVGDTISYTWLFGDGAASTEQNPSWVYSDPGTYTASLIVTDNNGASSEAAELVITVLDGASNNPPTASFTATPNPAAVGTDISFDSSNSMDPDGDNITYAWNFGDGTTSSSASPTHSYSSEGSYAVNLVVTDSMGAASNTASETIIVEAGVNQPPTANFTATPNPATVDSAVQFDASNSSDPEGDALTYRWDFGDGSSSTLENPSHTYTSVGSYQTELVVTDSNSNASQPSIETITVNEAGEFSGVPEPWPETKDLNIIWFGASTTAHQGGSSTPTYDIPRMVRTIYGNSLTSGEVDNGEYSINTDGGTSLGDWLGRTAFSAVESGPSNGGKWDYVVATAIKSIDPSQFPPDGTISIYDALERTNNSSQAEVLVNYPVPRLNGRFSNDTDSEALLTRYECVHTLARASGPAILNSPTSIAMDTVYQSLPDASLIARLKNYANFPASFPDDYQEDANIFIFDVSGFSVDPEHFAQAGSFFVANVFAVYLYGINPIGQPLPEFDGFCASSPSNSLCSISDNKRLFLQAVAYDSVVRYRLGERSKRNGLPVGCDDSDQLIINGMREDAYLLDRFGG